MPAATEIPFTGVFDQAMQTYGEAIKAGVRAQEQIAAYWTDAIGRAIPATAEFQRKSKAFVSESAPAAQRNTEDMLKFLEQNYRRSVELVKRAYETGTAAATGEFQSRLQSLWESSVELLKDNAQAVAQTNLRVLDLWADLLRHNNGVTAAPPPSPKGPGKQG